MQKPEADILTLGGVVSPGAWRNIESPEKFRGIVRRGGLPIPALPAGPVTLVDKGGAVIDHVKVHLVFWGSVWGGATTPSMGDVIDAVVSIVTGPYMFGLSQYRNIQPGTLSGSTSVTSAVGSSPPDPPNPFTVNDIQTLLSNLIAQQKVPSPSDAQLLYCVILPPNAVFKDNKDSKDQKDKDAKDSKDNRDGKNNKDNKDTKDSKDRKDRDAKIKDTKEKEADAPGIALPALAALTQGLDALSLRVRSIEQELVQGTAFIRPEERPPVGEEALKEGSANAGTIIGEHSSYTYYAFPFYLATVRWGWVSNDGTLDFVTQVFSHELAEACTDPDPLSGFVVTAGCPSGEGPPCEIGDLCEGSLQRVNGVLVQQYWSSLNGACAVPTKADKDNLDNKGNKDNKDGKDNKDTKDSKDHKDRDAKIKDTKEKEADAPASATSALQAISQSLDAIGRQVAAMEQELARGKAFIRPEERPAVGDQAVKEEGKQET